MDLSVIIVCYKGWEKLTLCLESLEWFQSERFSFEVLVVDNNSGDDQLLTLEKRFASFRFLRNRVNGGYANGCNLGFKESVGEHILILNPDTIVTEDAISELLDELKKNKNCGIVSCRQVRSDGRMTKPWGNFPALPGRKRNNPDSGAEHFFPDWVSGSLMLMTRDLYIRLNGFDERYWMYSEDVDLCRRTRDLGYEVALFNNITIEHNHGGSSRIDLRTTALTKTEVQTSRHLYISIHLKGAERALMHLFIIADNMVSGLVAFIAGSIFFFIPKLRVRVLIFLSIIAYYWTALKKHSWVSRRSVTV